MKKYLLAIALLLMSTTSHAEFYQMKPNSSEARVDSNTPKKTQLSPEQMQLIEKAQQTRLEQIRKRKNEIPATEAYIFLNADSLEYLSEAELIARQSIEKGADVQLIISFFRNNMKQVLKKLSTHSSAGRSEGSQWMLDPDMEKANKFNVTEYPTAALLYKGKPRKLKAWRMIGEAVEKIGPITNPNRIKNPPKPQESTARKRDFN